MLAKRIGQLRWQIPLLAFILVLAHQLLEHAVLYYLPRWQHFWTQFMFYGVLGPFLAWKALSYIEKRVMEKEEALRALQLAHQELEETSLRLEFLIGVNHRLIETEDEEELINLILQLPREVIPSLGSSLIRFDGKHRPLSAIHSGELSPEVFENWANHLSSQDVQETCQYCSIKWAVTSGNCPILNHMNVDSGIRKVYCLELTRGERRFANLIVYLSDENRPNSREEKLLKSMAGEMSLALEGYHLRSRELEMLSHIQDARNTDSLNESLAIVLSSMVEALDAGGGLVVLQDGDASSPRSAAQVGELSEEQEKMIVGMSRGVSQTKSHLRIDDLDQQSDLRSLLIVPLHSEDLFLGSISLWSSIEKHFTKRHVQLASTVAGQAALKVENHQLYLEVSFQAALAERARLAREIHDGLAQTLGYLKLRTGQILKWLANEDVARSQKALTDLQLSLSGAYTDAREAIDGLRIKIEPGTTDNWLEHILLEFQQLTPLQVETPSSLKYALLPEIQVQLQRIVQEALSNIRKYSQASQVTIEWIEGENGLTLQIKDNGVGFDIEEVPPISRHGLRIMKERAELLDGSFEIHSQLDIGTTISVSFPVERIKTTAKI